MYFLVKSYTVFLFLWFGLVFVLAGLGIHQGGLPSRLRFDDKNTLAQLGPKVFWFKSARDISVELIMISNNSLYIIFI